MGESKEVCTASRFTSLDGLRGVAAFVVLLHHCFLVSPQFSDVIESGGTLQVDSWVWWTTFTPLHLIWAGREAVYVFFILSGFVLTLPFLRALQPSLRAYYSKRLVRIYLPVWGSIIFALLMGWAFPRLAGPDYSSWLNLHDEAPNVITDALLLWGAGQLNSPLWSLQWEMIFSLLLPLYWVAAAFFRRAWPLAVCVLVLLIAAAELSHEAGLEFLPMFGIGALMAAAREELERWALKLRRRGWLALVVTSLVLICSHWLFPQLPVPISAATIGGALLVFIFIGCKTAITLGNKSSIHWLGVRSFSLYLVHEPIIVSVAFSLHATNPFLVGLFALPLSLLAAEVFFRLVERPSHRLARLAGRAVTNRGRRQEEVSIA